jgi:hypothetical protein
MEKIQIRDKHPGSATLLLGVLSRIRIALIKVQESRIHLRYLGFQAKKFMPKLFKR